MLPLTFQSNVAPIPTLVGTAVKMVDVPEHIVSGVLAEMPIVGTTEGFTVISVVVVLDAQPLVTV